MVKITPTPSAAGPALYGADIYHGDGDIQMHALKDTGLAFVWIKATQGRAYTDPAFATNWARAKSVGLTRGAYHFFDPETDPIAQATHFHNTVPLQKGDLVLGLDVETDGLNVGAKAYDCAQEIKRLTGRWPAIYSSDSFYQEKLKAFFPAGLHLLWIARYGREPVTPCAFWQYAETGRVPGVPHPLDTDIFRGDSAALATHCM
jgi:lysozyme